MALIIEDGTGIPGAEAYANLAAFDAWSVLAFGVAVAGTDAIKEAAIRRATAYLDGLSWYGVKSFGRSQDLAWPRTGAFDRDGFELASDEIPTEVITAQHILARAELASPGVLSPDVTLSGRKVLVGVGSLSWQVQSAPNTAEAARPIVTMAMDRLKGLIRPTGTGFVERA